MLVVPDLSAPEVMLSTPKVWFARNAREFTALTSGLPPAPTAVREFRRTDRLLIRFDAYAPAARADDRDGAAPESAGHEDDGRARHRAGAKAQTYSIDFPLASLAPGQYLLEITATSEGHKPVTELVAFRLGSRR